MSVFCPVPPEISPAKNQSQLAFRDRNTTLEFVINRASPDVVAEDIDWVLESSRLEQNISISAENDNRYIFNLTRRSLTIVSLTIDDTGRYRITATNPAGIRSNFIDLDVQGRVQRCFGMWYTPILLWHHGFKVFS